MPTIREAVSQRPAILKVAATAFGAGSFHSLWKVAGYPSSGATPATGAGAVPLATTPGAIYFSDRGRLDRVLFAGAQPGTLLVYDRLVHTSGLSGTVATPQTVNSTAITRPNNQGVDAELWLEWYTPTGSTPRTVTASYTNTAGTAGRTTATASIPASPVAGFMLPLGLQASSGDLGVQSVQTVTLSGSTGTAGDFGVTLMRRVAELALITSDVPVEDVSRRRVEIEGGAALSLVLLCSGTDTGLIVGSIGLV